MGRQSFLQLDFKAGKFENKKENAKLARLTERFLFCSKMAENSTKMADIALDFAAE